MMTMNRADVHVNFDDGIRLLKVKCVINFEDYVTDFRFSLSTLLTIDSITSDTDTEWKIIKEWKPQWQYKSNEIEVLSKKPVRKIIIQYHGPISGWCNIIEERRIALSEYSAWTISETSVPVNFIFKMSNMEDYFFINSRYDPSEKIWIYGETGHDTGNIIALKKGYYHVANTGNFNFYYLNDAENVYAESYIYYYDDIIRYYSSVFPQRDINKMDIVSLDMENGGGAYFRKELVVIDKIHIAEDKDLIRESTISLLAHELGHNWFSRANTSSWEDWLNETGAEWAALLYILSINDEKLFNKNLSWAKDKYRDTPIIKPSDLKRPEEGVHIRGVMLFYELYRRYGIETILNILRVLADLQDVSTDNFLLTLKGKVDDTIPELIEQGLTIKDYNELFQ